MLIAHVISTLVRIILALVVRRLNRMVYRTDATRRYLQLSLTNLQVQVSRAADNRYNLAIYLRLSQISYIQLIKYCMGRSPRKLAVAQLGNFISNLYVSDFFMYLRKKNLSGWGKFETFYLSVLYHQKGSMIGTYKLPNGRDRCRV